MYEDTLNNVQSVLTLYEALISHPICDLSTLQKQRDLVKGLCDQLRGMMKELDEKQEENLSFDLEKMTCPKNTACPDSCKIKYKKIKKQMKNTLQMFEERKKMDKLDEYEQLNHDKDRSDLQLLMQSMYSMINTECFPRLVTIVEEAKDYIKLLWTYQTQSKEQKRKHEENKVKVNEMNRIHQKTEEALQTLHNGLIVQISSGFSDRQEEQTVPYEGVRNPEQLLSANSCDSVNKEDTTCCAAGTLQKDSELKRLRGTDQQEGDDDVPKTKKFGK